MCMPRYAVPICACPGIMAPTHPWILEIPLNSRNTIQGREIPGIITNMCKSREIPWNSAGICLQNTKLFAEFNYLNSLLRYCGLKFNNFRLKHIYVCNFHMPATLEKIYISLKNPGKPLEFGPLQFVGTMLLRQLHLHRFVQGRQAFPHVHITLTVTASVYKYKCWGHKLYAILWPCCWVCCYPKGCWGIQPLCA